MVFRRDVKNLDDIVRAFLRQNGLETPVLQTRLIDSWGLVAGEAVERYTEQLFIRNQTLFVKIKSPALRSDLSMIKSDLVIRLNHSVGGQVITDIRFY